MTIPKSVDEVTPQWLSEALDADVSAVEVLDAHSGTTGRARIGIETSADLPETLFVKLQPFDEEQQAFLAMIGLGVSEAKLYAAVGNELPVRSPKAWHASHDDADGFVMVLEDLEAAGCRFATADDDDVLSIAESLMDELAVLHATYWGQDLPWIGQHALSPGDSPETRERLAMGAMIVQSALDQHAADMAPEFRRLGEIYIGHNGEIADMWAGSGEHTLIHGDDHIGNLFVDGGRTGFYDWAVASSYAGMRDVAYFLCNSLPTDVRRAEQDSLIARYRAGLAAGGVELDADLATEQYRLFSIYSWISSTTTWAMGSKWQPAEVGKKSSIRTTQAIADLDVLDLLADRLDLGPGSAG